MKKREKNLRIGYRFKILLSIIISCLIIGGMIAVSSLQGAKGELLQGKKDLVAHAVQTIANSFDASVLNEINVGDEDTDTYKKAVAELRNHITGDSVEYIYIMKKVDGKVKFWIDADTENPSDIGEEYDAYDTIQRAFAGELIQVIDTGLLKEFNNLSSMGAEYSESMIQYKTFITHYSEQVQKLLKEIEDVEVDMQNITAASEEESTSIAEISDNIEKIVTHTEKIGNNIYSSSKDISGLQKNISQFTI